MPSASLMRRPCDSLLHCAGDARGGLQYRITALSGPRYLSHRALRRQHWSAAPYDSLVAHGCREGSVSAGSRRGGEAGGDRDRLGLLASGEVEVQQRTSKSDIGDHKDEQGRAEQIHGGDRKRREQQREPEYWSWDLAQHPEGGRDDRCMPPVFSNLTRAPAERLADRAVLEQHFLLYELPIDKLLDRVGDPDDGDAQQEHKERRDQLHGDQPPQTRPNVRPRCGKPGPASAFQVANERDDGGGGDWCGERSPDPGRGRERDEAARAREVKA